MSFSYYLTHPAIRNRILRLLRHPVVTFNRLLKLLDRDQEVESRALLRNLALMLPERVRAKYSDELRYLESVDMPASMFPYERVRPSAELVIKRDPRNGLVYVVHRGEKFYYPRGTSEEELADAYHYYVEVEGILGTGCLTRSPHSYVSPMFSVEAGDVLVDIGCSDALFAFDNAEKAGRIYLIEAWKRWIPALKASFAPYADKTSIVRRYVGDGSDGRSVRLEEVLKDSATSKFFIKMDIEGAEREVLRSSVSFLKTHQAKLAVCVYHRQDDAAVISNLLTEIGFQVSYSDGYVLTRANGIHYPYFRHGVIYARNY